jgi:hypothetical protein
VSETGTAQPATAPPAAPQAIQPAAPAQPVQQNVPRGQRVSAAQGESPLIAAAKRLGLWVAVGVLGVFLGSCAVGYAIVSVGGGGALAGARNVGLMVLALFYLIQVAIWSVLYFALAWLIGFYGPKLPQALRWTGGKLTTVEQVTRSGSERYIVRPLASTVRVATQSRALVSNASREAAHSTAPLRRWTRELSDWPTLQNRLRGKRDTIQ